MVAGWLLALTIVGVRELLGPEGPLSSWLIVHLLLLGAVSNAILIWSVYFSDALLRTSAPSGRRGEGARLVLFNAGALAVVLAMNHDRWGVVAMGAAITAVAVSWHAVVLLGRLSRSLSSRFAVTIRYYVAAAALLVVGVVLGVVMAGDDLSGAVHARLELAHVVINLLGWVGLTVVGTSITLWPTMLRTRVAEDAESAARRALPVLLGGLFAVVGGALTGSRVIAVAGVVGYLGGLMVAVRPHVHETRQRPPAAYATWSVLAGYVWLVVAVAAVGLILATARTWEFAVDSVDHVSAPLLVGFAAQTLLGALSYLLPVVLGGGPSISRATTAIFDVAARPRVAIINVGLVVFLLPVPSAVRTGVAVVVLGLLALFLLLAVRAALVARSLRRQKSP